ncbi:hypothetical protein Hanom_Chr04g00286631 [Helianthus anomalus]
MHSFSRHVVEHVVDIVSQVLESIQPFFDRFMGNLLLGGIGKQILDPGECLLQLLELIVNTLSTSNSLEGFIGHLLNKNFEEFICKSFSSHGL